MRVIGLTGSIGMGKTTTARCFKARGVPVHDADAAVHALYEEADAAAAVETAFPGATMGGVVSRARLAEQVLGDADALARLEAIIHPLVRRRETEFLTRCASRGVPLALLDIPLLFETGRAADIDVVVVVTTTPEIQRERVLSRPGMTEARLAVILARQTPDAEKRERAHFLVDTGRSHADAARQVDAIVRALAASS
jgi:dephospho-CoA kinase